MKSDKAFWDSEDGLRLVRGWALHGLAPWEMARKAGMSCAQLQELARERPALNAAMLTTSETADLLVEEALLSKALAGDVRACSYWLKNRKGDSWADSPRRHMDEGAAAAAAGSLAALASLLQGAHEARDIEEFV